MLPKHLISRLKQSKLPYHLTQEDIPNFTPLYPNEVDSIHQLQNLLNSPNHRESSSDKRRTSLHPNSTLQNLEIIRLVELDQTSSNGQRKNSSKLNTLLLDYLSKDTLVPSSYNRRIKCGSLERLSPEDLCVFYRYSALLKKTKKIGDENLWSLLEIIKSFVLRHPNGKIQTFCQDLTKILLSFVFSSIAELRFDKCKSLLERLENIEKSVTDFLFEKDETQDHSYVSMGDTFHMNSQNSIKTLKDVTETRETFSPDSRRASFLKNQRRESNKDEDNELEYKEILSIISKMKYTMARVGHLLHYDRLSNPVNEIITKNFEQKRHKLSSNFTHPSIGKLQEIPENHPVLSSTFENSSFDMKAEKNKKRIDHDLEDRFKNSNYLKDYLYTTHSALNDFEKETYEKRTDQLRKYAKWKATKWVKKSQRMKLEKKYQEQTIICRICAQEMKTGVLKEHSNLCRKQGEIEKSQKVLDKKLAEMIHQAQIKSKNVHTNIVLSSKWYYKLKEKVDSPRIQGRPSRGYTINHPTTTPKINPTLSNSHFNFNHLPENPRPRGFSGGFQRPHTTIKALEKNFSAAIEEHIFPKIIIIPDSVTENASEVDFIEKRFLDEEEEFVLEPEEESKKKQNRFTKPILLSQKSTILYGSNDKPEKLSKGKASSPQLKPNHNPLIKPSKTKKRKSRKQKTQANHDTNCNFYSDPEHSGKKSSSSSDSRESVESVVSTAVMTHGNYFDTPSHRKTSLFSPDRSPVEAHFSLHTPTISPLLKKSRFATLSMTEKNPEEKRITDEVLECVSGVNSGEEINNARDSDSFSFSPHSGEKNPHIASLPSSTIFSNLNQSGFKEGIESPEDKAKHDMSKLKSKVMNKKVAKQIYDFIAAKGKVLINEGAYQKKMEVYQETMSEELAGLISKTEDTEAKAMAWDFISVSKNRIKNKKDLQDLTKLLGDLVNSPKSRRVSTTHKTNPNSRRNSTSKNRPRNLRLNLTSSHRKNLLNMLEGEIDSPVFPSPNKFGMNTKSAEIGSEDRLSVILKEKSHGLMSQAGRFKAKRAQELFNFSMNSYIEDVIKPSNQMNSHDVESEAVEEISVGFERKITGLTITSPRKSLANESDFDIDHMPQKLLLFQSTTENNTLIIQQKEKSKKKSDNSSSNSDSDSDSDSDDEDSSENTTPKSTKIEKNNEHPMIPFWDRKSTISDIKPDSISKGDNSSKNSLRNLDVVHPLPPIIPLGKTATRTIHLDKVPQEEADENEEEQQPKVQGAGRRRRNFTVGNPPPTMALKNTLAEKVEVEAEAEPEKKMDEIKEEKEAPKKKVKKAKSLTLDKNSGGNKGGNSPGRKGSYAKRNNPTFNQTKKEEKIPSLEFILDKVENVKEEDKEQANQQQFGGDGSSFDDSDSDNSSLDLRFNERDRGYYSDGCVKDVEVTFPIQPMIGIKDFKPIKMISKGAFGRVWLMKRNQTNDYYAIKIVNLAEKGMKNSNELNNLRNENRVFGRAEKDFIVRALFTFTHDTFICFAMEYMVGGDFGDIIQKYGCLDEDIARFYIAEIVLALEYLHSLKVIHRDLKPDNILLDKNGHAKLTDFGLSEVGISRRIKANTSITNLDDPGLYQKIEAINQLCQNNDSDDENEKVSYIINGKTLSKKDLDTSLHNNSRKVSEDQYLFFQENIPIPKRESRRQSKLGLQRIVGTPDYMSPEIIQGLSVNNYSIDWWSLGVLLFEFLCGVPPFNDDTPEKIFDNILNLNIPWDQIQIGYGEDCMSPEAVDLIKQLLTIDYTKRLGSEGAWQIKEHKFFKGIDWDNLRKQKAPIIPEKKGEGDTDNFARMESKIMDKERESPFVHLIDDNDAVHHKLEAKKLLRATSHQFNQSNYAALYCDNLKYLEEKLMEHERALQEVGDVQNDGIFDMADEIFDEKY